MRSPRGHNSLAQAGIRTRKGIWELHPCLRSPHPTPSPDPHEIYQRPVWSPRAGTSVRRPPSPLRPRSAGSGHSGLVPSACVEAVNGADRDRQTDRHQLRERQRQGRERDAGESTPEPNVVAAAASACPPPNSLSRTLASPKRMGHCEAALQADALVHQQLPEERGRAAWGPSGGARRRGALHGGAEVGPGNQGLFRRSGAEPRTEKRARPRPSLCVSHRGLWGKLRHSIPATLFSKSIFNYIFICFI